MMNWISFLGVLFWEINLTDNFYMICQKKFLSILFWWFFIFTIILKMPNLTKYFFFNQFQFILGQNNTNGKNMKLKNGLKWDEKNIR